jgi:hypothetical protein
MDARDQSRPRLCSGCRRKNQRRENQGHFLHQKAFVCQMRGGVSSFQFSAFGSKNLKLETEIAIGFHPACPSSAHS